jgi:hypothetical protein
MSLEAPAQSVRGRIVVGWQRRGEDLASGLLVQGASAKFGVARRRVGARSDVFNDAFRGEAIFDRALEREAVVDDVIWRQFLGERPAAVHVIVILRFNKRAHFRDRRARPLRELSVSTLRRSLIRILRVSDTALCLEKRGQAECAVGVALLV